MNVSPLPRELLHLIFHEVRLESPEALRAVSLANRELHFVSEPYLNYTLVVNIGNGLRAQEICLRLRNDAQFRSFVKDLRVIAKRSLYGETQIFGIVSDLLAIFRECYPWLLKEFRWSVNIDLRPSQLETISKVLPDCSIFLDMYQGGPIPKTPKLVSVNAVVHLDSDPLNHLQPLLVNAPELRCLKVTQGAAPVGAPLPPFLESAVHPELVGQPFPALEELTISNFSKTINVNGLVSFSRIHTLEIHECSSCRLLLYKTLHPIGTVMPLLRHLTISLQYVDSLVYRYLVERLLSETALGLHSIVLLGRFHSLATLIVEFHGHTLRKLVLHEPEWCREPQRQLISASALESIARECTVLEELHIDVDITESKDAFKVSDSGLLPILAHPSSFRTLRSLTLTTLLGIHEKIDGRNDEICEPSMSASEARTPLFHLFSVRPGLKNLTLHVGEDRQLNIISRYRGESRWREWESHHRYVLGVERVLNGDVRGFTRRGNRGDMETYLIDDEGKWTPDGQCVYCSTHPSSCR